MDSSNHGDFGPVEAALRSERPRLDGDVESAICGRVGRGRSGGGRRMSLAIVLSVGTLGAMSAFGGVGYASFGGLNPLHSDHNSPAKDEYGKPGKGPKHHKNDNGNNGKHNGQH